jgi:hypothetical protein
MTTTSPDMTRAAKRYLEQYGDRLVMNTYLKITILVLATVCLALAALVFRSQRALANMHPLIVRINEVGTFSRTSLLQLTLAEQFPIWTTTPRSCSDPKTLINCHCTSLQQRMTRRIRNGADSCSHWTRRSIG